MPVILTTQEVEIRRISVLETLPGKKKSHKRAGRVTHAVRDPA
jgi:hypothetical protein